MPAPTKKRPPMEMEPGEGAAHEKGESAEEEVREGTEASEKENYSKKPSRKRSAKGAKKTKAPMDSEGCGCGGKKGATCDGNCGYGMKKGRTDALTAPEYLAACDLGIQDRSRSYIRARLDMAERLDLKCGNGSISPGEKCSKGSAQQAPSAKKQFRAISHDPVAAKAFLQKKASTKGIGNKVKATGELAARLGGGAAMGYGLQQAFWGAASGNIGEAVRGFRNVQLGSAAVQVSNASRANRQGNKGLAKEFLKSAGRQAAIGVGVEAGVGAYAGFNRAGGATKVAQNARRAYQGARMRASGVRTMPRTARDSAYASGFSLNSADLAI